MALGFLSGAGSANNAALFEIRYVRNARLSRGRYSAVPDRWLTVSSPSRLDSNALVFRGQGDEATGALLKGTLVLCLSQPLKFSNIHMRFTGETKLE
jgi:hypothetical protein